MQHEQRVIILGTFDLFHVGHLRALRFASTLGTFLEVGIESDDMCMESKGRYPVISEDHRAEIVQNVKGVDSAFIYRNHFYEGFIGPKNYQVLAWNEANEKPRHLAFLEYCRRSGIKIVPIPRTPGVSSTEIKADIAHNCRFAGACNV